ncbi:MAG: inositol monophosphatase family protein [Deltaproteobacteria bacterium]|nr:inositol monophosphatase family protein [Deltaproteobacteria bacterium]
MENFFSAAWQAAQTAGALIRENWQQTKQIHYKSAIDLVTTVDRQAEERIVHVLQKHFPDHSILAEEETTIVGSQSGYRWIIDPLDGTTNFAHAYPHFCISIALEREGEIILGLVYDPLREESFKAARGEGAFLNGNPIHTSKITHVDRALLATGFPYDRRERAAFYLTFLKAFMVRSQGVRCNGSAALDLCYLACGRIDGFWELKLHSWDTAAGSLIVREAGGTITGFAGNEFSVWGEEILGSNGLIHAEMLGIISEAKNVDSSLVE